MMQIRVFNITKRVLTTVLCFFIFFSLCTACTAKEMQNEKYLKKIENYMLKTEPERKYVVLHYEFGNFTDSGNTEILVFFDRQKQKPEVADSVRLIKLFVFDGKLKISRIYNLDFSNIVLSKKGVKDIYDGQAFGERRRTGWFYDFNKNGRLELILESGYRDFVSFRIIEFTDNDFKEILDFKEENVKILEVVPENKTMILERWRYDETGNCISVRTLVTWNEKKKIYEENDL